MANNSVLAHSHERTRKLVMTALLAALIVVLQGLSYFVPIKVGPFSLSFVLIPIVVGAALLGPSVGASLGLVFGIIVLAACIGGVDGGGAILFAANPFLCSLLCLVKGVAAGWLSGLVFKALSGNSEGGHGKAYVSSLLASAVAPIANTGIFCVLLSAFFFNILQEWAGGKPILTYIFTGLVGANFIFELLLNVILCPVIIVALRSTKFFRR